MIMTKIFTKLFKSLEIGDDLPPIVMGVLNLSPESFFKGSVYEDMSALKSVSLSMTRNGAKILDIGARSTAPWSNKISLQEEINRIIPAIKTVCKIIQKDVLVSIDTQYMKVAKKAHEIAKKYDRNVIINDVSSFNTDTRLKEYVVEQKLPVILMASKEIPGDILTIEEIIEEFRVVIENLINNGYDENLIILDPGIGRWVEEKTPECDMKIITNLEKLRVLGKPILVALSRKSFIGAVLNIEEPENRFNGTLAATAIAVYNGAHIIRTHDVNSQLKEILIMAKSLRDSK
ncbi:MAG: dihydropteroate synthase [Candidatus Lokiarchaeota archaeon]|nr:dihydropteroate synthase [Candidatus Lokiarchaeota archaeon]MBD3343292.1 dihydropteroate synthase [Candidatus Lokiarchaeota archaeon]